MSFGEGVSGISENVAAHPTKDWWQRQQRSRKNTMPRRYHGLKNRVNIRALARAVRL
jgi:hypothetical protein